MLHGDYLGIMFPYASLRTSKQPAQVKSRIGLNGCLFGIPLGHSKGWLKSSIGVRQMLA